MKKGDEVTIVRSPYIGIRAGTVATIEEVRLNHFGKNKHLYILADLSHKRFRAHELRLLEKK